MAPKVLISDALSPAAVQIFKDRGVDVDFQPNLGKDKEKLAEIIGNYDGLAIRSATKATAKILEKAKKLKVIGRAGIGVDNVEIPAATAKGIIVMNTPFGNSITTAEHAITLMLALAREIPQADISTQAGKWEKNRFMGVEITGKVLGVIGCGNIGSIVADRAHGLKMKVVAYDPYLSPERAVELGVDKVELDELLARADFITLHTPLTDQTRNILSRENLAKTRKGVRIINCARGGLIDEAALKDASTSIATWRLLAFDGSQAGLNGPGGIQAPRAWDVIHDSINPIASGFGNVITAVVDTGVDYNHPDLFKNIWVNQGEIPPGNGPFMDLDADGLITLWDLNDPVNQGGNKILDVNANSRIDGGDRDHDAALLRRQSLCDKEPDAHV